MEYAHHYRSPLGGLTMASDGEALIGLWFDGQKVFPSARDRELRVEKPLPVFDLADRWLDVYFSGRAPDFTPPLSPAATPFRKTVWELLLTVPYGRTTTYGAIAARIAKRYGLARMSAQAVGGAVGRNPISLIIPCHRVIGADGSLTGYAAGVGLKAKLLALERADPSVPFAPK